MRNDDRLTMRDIVDGELVSKDGRSLGRVADIEIEIDDAGVARLRTLMIGPEALAGRVSSRLRPPLHWLLRGRFDHRIPLDEVADIGSTLTLRRDADHYPLGHADTWVYEHLLRFIPGSGSR